MKKLVLFLVFFLSMVAIDGYAQSGSTGFAYGYEYCDSVEVVEEIECIEAVDSLDYVDYSLIDVIKPRDWNRLVLDREQALVAQSFDWISIKCGLTYNEVNILVYYPLIPLTWCIIFECWNDL